MPHIYSPGGGDAFLQTTVASFHVRQNQSDQNDVDQLTFKVIEAAGYVHTGLSQPEMERLCLSSPGCRVIVEPK